MAELGVVGPDGSAMRDKQGRIFFAGSVVEGLVEIAMDKSAVFAFELDVLGLNELELADEGVVGLGESQEFVARGGLRVEFPGPLGQLDLTCQVSIVAQVGRVDREL